MTKIKSLIAREVLDSRGNPTVEVEVWTEKSRGRAIVPSGASTGAHEAVELRDGDNSRYGGKGVLQAVENVKNIIAPELMGLDCLDFREIDRKMLALDGTVNKSRLGANAILAVSLAVAQAGANEKGLYLYEYLNEKADLLPLPMMNIINGGKHADSGLDIQEFMVMPVGAKSFKEALRMGAEIFHTLKSLLQEVGMSTAVGDEGGFAPNLPDNEKALEFVTRAIEKAGYKLWDEVMIALDVAATELYDEKSGLYSLRIGGKQEKLSAVDLVAYYDVLLRKFPIISIEDSHSEDDWQGWTKMNESVGAGIQLVGDDLLVTNVKRLATAIEQKACNAILVKVNQIGSLSETLEAVKMAQANKMAVVISHRSGETEDVAIADLAVGLNAGQIKTGSLCRTDRVCKYNQLLRIEERLGEKAKFAGAGVFKR